MTHLEDKLLSFESKNLLWSFSGWIPKWALCYLKSGSKLILGEVSANISKLLRKERGKVPRICWCSHSQTCKKCIKRIWLLGLCFGKKTRPWSFCCWGNDCPALPNSFFALQPLIMNCIEVQTLNVKWIFLKGQVHSTYLYGIWSIRKLKLLMILRKEGSIPEWKSSSVNSPRDWQDLPIYTLACELWAAKPACQDVRARLFSETNKNIQSTCSLQLSAFTH